MILRFLSPTMLLAALWVAPAFSQTYTFTPQSSRDLALTFQSQREGGTRVLIQGEIRNSSTQTAERVMVKAEGLDENGRVVSRARGYVLGVLPSRGSASFEIRINAAGSEKRYRVQIESFEFAVGGGN